MADAVGIDIGGTNTKAVAVDAGGRRLAEWTVPTPAERGALIAAVRELIASLPAAPRVGVSSPGLAGEGNRAIRWMRGRMNCVEGLDWSDALGREAPVLNDAHAACLGECWCGAAAGKRHVVMLTLGTGVGGGVVVDGRLLQGAIGRAGHLGHISLDWRGEPDIVGTPGSLEDLVGDHTVGRRTGGRFADTAALVAGVEAGDAEARAAWEQAVRALACGVVSLINAFDPEAVVIGGGIARAGATLFEPLRAWLDRWEWRPTDRPVELAPAALGEWAGAVGAARFAMSCASMEMKA